MTMSFLWKFCIILALSIQYIRSQAIGYWQDTDCSSCNVPCAFYVLTCGNSGLGFSCSDSSMSLYPPGATGSHDVRGCMVCPVGTYQSSSLYCADCTTGCKDCGSASICTACDVGYYLYNQACINQCPAGYFIKDQECVACPSTCQNCNSAEVCTTCIPGYGLIENQCVNCPIGTYLDTMTCTACPTECESCEDASTCLSCKTGYYIHNSLCPPSCPDGFYESGTICSDCPVSCKKCTDSGTCQECNSGWGLLGTDCVICPAGYYLSSGVCQVCPPNCATCSSASTCLSCDAGFSLSGSSCASTCLQGTFVYTGICIDCPKTCVTCVNASYCGSCYKGYGLNNGQCVGCPTSTYLLNGQCVAYNLTSQALSNSTTLVTNIATTVSSVVSVGSSNPLTFGLISKTIEKIRFLQIGYSQELEDVFLSWSVDIYSITIPNKIAEQLVAKETPKIFSIYGIDSAFLMNYWGDMMLIGIALATLITLKLFDYLLSRGHKNTFFYVIYQKLQFMVQNYLIVTIYGGLGDVVFYLILEMQTLKLGSTASVISFLSSILFLVFGIVCLSLQIWILVNYQKNKKESEDRLKKFCKRFATWGVLFQDFKDTNLLTQGFMTVLITRDIVMNIVSIALTSAPLAQAIIFLSCSILVFLYLFLRNPFEGRYDKMIQYVLETMILTVNICVVILAVMDSAGAVEFETRKHLGKAIFISNIVLNLVTIFCMAFQLIQLGFAVYKAVTFVIAYYSEVVEEVQEAETDKTVQSTEKTESNDLSFTGMSMMSPQKLDSSSDQMFLPRIRRPRILRNTSRGTQLESNSPTQRGLQLERNSSIQQRGMQLGRNSSIQRGLQLERNSSISTSPDRDRRETLYSESSETMTRDNSPVRSRRSTNNRGVVRRNQQAPPLNSLFYLYQHNNSFKQAVEGVRPGGGRFRR